MVVSKILYIFLQDKQENSSWSTVTSSASYALAEQKGTCQIVDSLIFITESS